MSTQANSKTSGSGTPEAAPPATRLALYGPAILCAVAFGIADVLTKVVFVAGASVLTLSVVRGLVGLVCLLLWFQVGPPQRPLESRQRWVAIALGFVFAGVIFGLFAAIERVEVPIAILTYFIYPLVTGLVAAALGLDRIGWRGIVATLAVFLGLALMIGAHPQQLALVGLAFSLGAAVCRVTILIVARAMLAGTDARVVTWYSMTVSTGVFIVASLLTQHWAPPQGLLGWAALIGVSIGTAIGVLMIFVSTERIGPFRSALVMNLEPLIAVVLSAPLLGEVITPLQGVGGAIMLGALVLFQMRR